jgi:hypothetical protein
MWVTINILQSYPDAHELKLGVNEKEATIAVSVYEISGISGA